MARDRRRLPLAPVANTEPNGPSSNGVTRRSALQSLAAGLGLAAGAPNDAHHAHHPLAAHVTQRPRKPAAAATTRHEPRFLDTHQFATLTLVSDLIVPGSVASGSPAWIDEVLAIEHDDVRRTFVGALAAVDAAAREQHGTTFRALTPARRLALLEAAEPRLAVSAPPTPPPPDAPAPSPAPAPTPLQLVTLTRPMTTLKTWIAGAHYSSEAGMKELGFTGSVFFEAFPACTHAEGHE